MIELLRRRRSIRRFQDRPVPPEVVDLLVETALRAPSSRGFNPWHFVVVRDPAVLGQLAGAKPHGASFLKNAPLGIVVAADPGVSDVWVEDASIAAVLLHLAAADLGLGSCWIQLRRRPHDENRSACEFVRELLGMPPELEVLAILAVGYPDEEKKPHPADSLQRGKVSYGKYGLQGCESAGGKKKA